MYVCELRARMGEGGGLFVYTSVTDGKPGDLRSENPDENKDIMHNAEVYTSSYTRLNSLGVSYFRLG